MKKVKLTLYFFIVCVGLLLSIWIWMKLSPIRTAKAYIFVEGNYEFALKSTSEEIETNDKNNCKTIALYYQGKSINRIAADKRFGLWFVDANGTIPEAM